MLPVVAVLLLAAAIALAGCGGSDERDEAPAAAPTTTPSAPEPATTAEPPEPVSTEPPAAPPKPPPGTPKFIAGYTQWTRLNDAPIPPRESGDAHLGTKNVYISQEIGANGRFPIGTIVVKEANRPGKDFIGLIATMRKQKGADPEHNDWVFVEYTRDARDERFSEIASGAVCWSCHAGAADSDYVFTAG